MFPPATRHIPPADQHQRAADASITYVKQDPVENLSIYVAKSRFSCRVRGGRNDVGAEVSSEREAAVSLIDES